MIHFLIPIRVSCKGKATRNKPGASKIVEGMWVHVNQTVIERGRHLLEEEY